MGACNRIAASTHTFLWPFLLSLLLSACTCARAQSCTTYAVQSDDTCYSISQAQGISLSDFESWNEGIDYDNLQIRQLVCISVPSSSSSPPSSSSGSGNGKVFLEYIGALWNDVTLTSMPVNTNVEVHYILFFAIDYTSDGSSPTNGNFAAFWDTKTITPAAVQAIKAEYPNIKVMLSQGGDTMGPQSTSVQFQPTSISSWVSNVVSSLSALVQTYGLDGIDIDYEHFDSTTDDDFASAIGQHF